MCSVITPNVISLLAALLFLCGSEDLNIKFFLNQVISGVSEDSAQLSRLLRG